MLDTNDMVPNSGNINEDELKTMALQIMSDNDIAEVEEIQEAEVVEEPKQVNGIFTHTVEAVPVYVLDGNGNYVQVDGFNGVNRMLKDGTSTVPEILHVAPSSTHTITMEQLEGIAEQLMQAGYKLHQFGEMKGNRWLFIELENDELPTLNFNGTKLVPKMWIGSSHDGTLAMKSTVKVIDTVCFNTFMLNYRSDVLFKAKHTKNADIRIKEYEQGIKDASQLLYDYYGAVDMLSSTAFSGRSKLEQYFATSIGAEKKPRPRRLKGKEYMSDPMFSGKHENQLEQLFDCYQHGAGQKERGETLWSAFSAVTDWCDNHEANEKSRALGTNVIGNRARQKQKAWTFANQIAEVAGNSKTTFIQ